MRVERSLDRYPLGAVAATAAEAEAEGYDGAWILEGAHDPFIPLFFAAEATERLGLATAIAVAFARNPLTTASIAHDLQRLSRGRFTLGLGAQIETHIRYRYGMPAGQPAARMREFVQAVRAIWDCWDHGTKLDFRGDFYAHTLMPPNFRHEPAEHPSPTIVIAGVGPRMTEVAGEVGDGYVAHSFTTESYVREVTLPTLARGRERAGLTLDGFELRGLVTVATGASEEQMDRSLREARELVAFYGSTPAYARVLDHHGWGELHTELHALSRADRWAEMPSLIDDEVLDAFAVVGEPREIGPRILARYGNIMDTIGFYTPTVYVPEVWAEVVDGLRG